MSQKKIKTNMKKELRSNLKDNEKRKPFNFRDIHSRFGLQFWKEFFKWEFKKRSLFLVVMWLRNGKYDMFTISTTKQSFNYHNGEYFIDMDLAIEDINTGLNVLSYHQDCSMPIKIEISIDKLTRVVNDTEKSVEKAINPFSLRNFINSQVIEKVLKGQELTDDIKQLRLILIVSVMLSAISVIMIAKAQGWF